MIDDQEEERPFLRRHALPIVLGIVVAGGAIIVIPKIFSGKQQAPRPVQQVTMVKILPPPPPPPPPPPRPPETRMMEQKMVEQQRMDDPDPKPDDKPPDSPAAMGTNVKGDGAPDGFGLAAGGGGYFGGGSGSSGHTGSRWGWYAGEVQTAVADALRKSVRTRNSSFRVEVRLWSDTQGKVTRAGLGNSTGNLALDDAITHEILLGMRLPEPPPADMPMPIVLRLSARRPN